MCDFKSHTHSAVLLKEVIDGLAIQHNGVYVDATFGRGGHSTAILAQLSDAGRLLAIDQDFDAITYGKAQWNNDPRIRFIHSSFADLANVLDEEKLMGKVHGILLDLGMSSPQLDNAERGFSFLRDGPLDMRMNTQQTLTAASWLADVSFNDLVFTLRTYGEESFAKNIARAIEKRRDIQPITRTSELAELIAATVQQRDKKKHPATKTFQAIRIVINQEIDALKKVLTEARDALIAGGRLAIISFHSLEDRMVKQFLQQQQGEHYPRDIPLSGFQREPTMRWIAKKIKPSEMEIQLNPRARSATLRIAEKIL